MASQSQTFKRKRPIRKLAPLPTEDYFSANIVQVVVKTEEQAVPNKRKRIKSSPGVCAVLKKCMVLASVLGSSVTVAKFDSNPGIHFEGIGLIKLVTTKWKLITYYDIYSLER